MKTSKCTHEHECPKCREDDLILNWNMMNFATFNSGFAVAAHCPHCDWNGYISFILAYDETIQFDDEHSDVPCYI